MLTPDEREDLLQNQANVYKVLNIATKPAQWFIGGLQLLFLGVFLVMVAVGTPIYMLCTGQHVGSSEVLTAILAVAALVLFFMCPWYFVVGGLFYFISTAWYMNNHEEMLRTHTLSEWVGVFLLLGYGQWLLRKGIQRALRPKPPAPVIPESDVEIIPPNMTYSRY